MMKTRIDIESSSERVKEFYGPVSNVLEHLLNAHSFDEEDVSLSVYIEFVDDEYIKQINMEQRNIDQVTDVLSFPATESINGKIIYDKYDIDYQLNELFLGDILICESRIFSQAEAYGHSAVRECVFLASHGLLHLLGYDHIEKAQEEIMNRLSEQVLKELGYER